MNDITSFKLPVELRTSIEFVLIGSFGAERGVLAQSIGASVDLVAFAQKESYEEARRGIFAPFESQLKRFVARSSNGRPHIVSKESDARKSDLVLVWRGQSDVTSMDEEFKPKIEICLEKHSTDLFDALYEASTNGVIWSLAEVIDLCQQHEETKRRRRFILIRTIRFSILAYVFIGVLSSLFYYFLV